MFWWFRLSVTVRESGGRAWLFREKEMGLICRSQEDWGSTQPLLCNKPPSKDLIFSQLHGFLRWSLLGSFRQSVSAGGAAEQEGSRGSYSHVWKSVLAVSWVPLILLHVASPFNRLTQLPSTVVVGQHSKTVKEDTVRTLAGKAYNSHSVTSAQFYWPKQVMKLVQT